MDPIEKAIRSALEKGDSDDSEFRERVYQAVRGALDRAIQANPQLTVERAIARRKSLQDKIAEIESEFAPALPPEDPVQVEQRLDEALLDILGQSPLARQPGQAGRLPEWPTLERGPQSASPPAVSPPAGAQPVQAPAAPPATSPPLSPPYPDSRLQPAPPARSEARVEPSMRGEPFVRTPSNGLTAGTARPDPLIAPAPPVRVEPPVAAAPSPRQEPSVPPARHEPPVVRGPAEPPAAVPQQDVSQAYAVDNAPLVDLGVLPEVPSQPDADFPSVIPPGLDTPDISAPVPAATPEVAAADRKARSRERRRPYAATFFGIAVLSLAAVGLLFAFQTGLLKSPEERDTAVHNPPTELPAEDFNPAGEGDPALTDEPIAPRDWVAVFSPDNPATASPPGDAKADPMQDDTGAFLRIRSGASGSAIVFDVPQEVLETLAGRHAVFSVTARAEDGKESEISIECNFGELGDCGRKRYLVGYEKAEYLFEIDLPNKRPGANGRIAINSDFSGQGKAIDVYAIRAAAQ